ncbi:MAG: acyl-CoA dehydrogenase family protein [Saprospiraceae bacterium]|nr:acyl-CoA dehydrogenase family protein [Saprospiraceae bacterium]
MSTATLDKTLLKGGAFLVSETQPSLSFIPEDFTEEQLMAKESVREFVEQEIHPYIDRIEKLEEGLIPSILDKFADLGFLGTHMPEEFGGSELDFITNSLIGEEIGPSGSFSVSYNAHTGIGMLPILYYGTEAQRKKYLPELITGKLKSSYCLTEPSSGSDALAAKSTAILSEDGTHYILNGQKMWITNAGFADIFTVFSQVDGNKFTAFILEKGMEGFTLGAEEKKLGIKGSSTRQIFMENVKVPVENLLGEIGKGHLIAFNVLNTGRFKLGVSCLGGAKKLTEVSIRYANEREQFKKPISSFGAIQHKLGEQVVKCFVTESATYRTAHLINEYTKDAKDQGIPYEKAKLDAAEEYALECSIIKIIGSETLDYCVDEAVQIHGGMGYSEEGTVARAYRDSRINRIFEGTNEINRMVILSTILKSAMKGEMDLMTPALAVQSELMNGTTADVATGPFADEQNAVAGFKKVLIMLLGTAAQQAMSGSLDLKTEQEILMNLADIIIDIFNAESTLLRVQKIAENYPDKNIAIYTDILKTYIHDSNARVNKNAMDAIASFVDAGMQAGYVSGVRKFTKYPLQNVKQMRRNIAEVVIKANEYAF